jgi:ribonuclease-3
VRPKKPDRRELEELLGYRFKNTKLLEEALTHSSARKERGGQDNERLEFLGDRVLGLAVAAMLFERFPEAREVEFALHYNALVRRDCCAAIAVKLELGPHIVMAASEARSGGRNKAVILADACEALLGAIFLDGGFAEAQAAVRTWWEPLIEGESPPERDAKTALQEYAQRQKRGLPKYTEVSRSGADHAPSFTVEVQVEGLKPICGSGPSLKKAQQAAAEALLIREAVWIRESENA